MQWRCCLFDDIICGVVDLKVTCIYSSLCMLVGEFGQTRLCVYSASCSFLPYVSHLWHSWVNMLCWRMRALLGQCNPEISVYPCWVYPEMGLFWHPRKNGQILATSFSNTVQDFHSLSCAPYRLSWNQHSGLLQSIFYNFTTCEIQCSFFVWKSELNRITGVLSLSPLGS